MKSIEEIQAMLVTEICNSIDNINASTHREYYNDLMGDTSFLIAGYLQQKLEISFQDWSSKRWVDDSLLARVIQHEKELSIWGVIIWGIENHTEQWAEPFYFDITLNESFTDFTKYTLLFGDLDHPEITYGEYTVNRNLWGQDYYSNDNWDPSEQNWRYIINGSNGS